jgi:hypothetical protein
MIEKWNEMSNTEIRMKMENMKMEYDVIKNQINRLLDKLDNLDNEYIKGYKELEKRSKK